MPYEVFSLNFSFKRPRVGPRHNILWGEAPTQMAYLSLTQSQYCWFPVVPLIYLYWMIRRGYSLFVSISFGHFLILCERFLVFQIN